MISTYLENTLRTLPADNVTEIFLWVIAVLFLVSLGAGIFRQFKGLVVSTPGLLISLGILGTFVGIVVGLMDFDPNDIDNSISLLLEGLKTAFITSLVGMGSAIVFKFLSATSLLGVRQGGKAEKDIGQALLEAMDKQNQGLDALRKAVAGEEESSLAGQLKLLRSDVNDHARAVQEQSKLGVQLLNSLHGLSEQQREHFQSFARDLWQHMEAFGEMLSKSATEQVINALKEVIVDFNKNLTEQFGENFKALDASVQRLVKWQGNYREQLAQMQENYQKSVEAITATESSLVRISEESQKIPEVMDQLSDVVKVNQHQIQELSNHLDAFVQVRDKAVDAVPEIGKRIDEMTSGVADGTKVLIEGLQRSGEELNKTIADSTKGLKDGLLQSTDLLANTLATGVKEFEKNTHALSTSLTGMAEEMNNNIRNMAGVLVESYNQLSEEAKSMTKAAHQAGEQLRKDVVDIQKRVADSIEQMQRRMESTLEEVFQTQTSEANRALEGVTAAIKTAVERTGDSINNQMSAIDQAMQREIERVMTEMGQALASISNQFTRDYEKLVKAMDRIVRREVRV